MKRRDLSEVLCDIRNEIPGFNKEELLEYTNWAILKLCKQLQKNCIEENEIYCNKDLINRILNEKDKYRMTKDIDNISIQYTELFDCENEEELYIKVYMSIYFYDNTSNNIENPQVDKKHWNDIWIIKLKEVNQKRYEDGKCDNCGAVMEYNELRKIFKCNYCGNVITTEKWSRDWEIVDIEVK